MTPPPRINFSGFQNQSVLFSYKDLENLFILLEPFSFFNVSQVLNKTFHQITKNEFLNFYKSYLEDLFLEKELDFQKIALFFSQGIASDGDCFFKQELVGERFLLKPKRSILQMQPLGLFASSIDKKIHIKSFAKDALSFGIKFNFPTIYEDQNSHTIIELDPCDLEYTKYIKLRKFIRHHTKPMVIEGNGERNIYPFRYSEELKEKIVKLSFFEKNGLTVCL